jgi:hypothetical protein
MLPTGAARNVVTMPLQSCLRNVFILCCAVSGSGCKGIVESPTGGGVVNDARQLERDANSNNGPIANREGTDGHDDITSNKVYVSAEVAKKQNVVTPVFPDEHLGYRLEKTKATLLSATRGKRKQTFRFSDRIVKVTPNPLLPLLAVHTCNLTEAEASELKDGRLGDGLFVVDLKKNKKKQLVARDLEATLALSYDIWSPDGRYAAFLRGNYGPIDIVESTKAIEYLEGKRAAAFRIDMNAERKGDEPAEVMRCRQWSTARHLEIDSGCCGYIWRYRVDVSTGEKERTECAEGYCEKYYRDGVILQEDDIRFGGSWLSKPEIFKMLTERVFPGWKQCLQTEGKENGACLEIRMWVGENGAIDKAEVTPVVIQGPSFGQPERACLQKVLSDQGGVFSKGDVPVIVEALVSVGNDGPWNNVCFQRKR